VTLKCSLFLVVLLLVMRTLLFGVLSVVQGSQTDASSRLSPVALLAMVAFVPLMIFVLWRLAARDLGRNLSQVGFTLQPPARIIAAGFAGAVACTALLVGVYVASDETLADVLTALTSATAFQRLQFLVIGIAASLAEETVFRGALQEGLERRFPVVLAVLLNAAIFSLYHINFGVTSLVSKFAFGLIFWATKRAGNSLTSSTLAHALFWCLAGTL
jgi:membrane protease YdiL (CAAX protease family)